MKQDHPPAGGPDGSADSPPGTPKIEYPTEWSYTLFGTSGSALQKAMLQVLGERQHSFSPSNTSKGGKYRSFKLSLTVSSERDRLELGAALGAHEAIIFVL